jgi:hypothetical protein
MKTPDRPLVGDCVRTGLVRREDVVALARAIFDGQRTLPLGATGCEVILRGHDGLTKHLQECIVTILLTSSAVVPTGTPVSTVEPEPVG